MRWVAIGAVVLACATGPVGAEAKAPPLVGFYVLSAGGELIAARPDGRVIVRRRLATIRTGTTPSSRLATAGGLLYVLLRRDQPPDQIVVVRPRDARALARWSLPADVRARTLTIAGDAVLIGANRVRRRVGEATAEDSVLVRFDFQGNVTARWTVRDGAEHDWWVASAEASRDGTTIAVSYHGGCSGEEPPLCTTGADLVDTFTGTRRHCVEPFFGSACVASHGLVDFFGDGWVAATGTPEILRLTSDGTEISRLDTKLANNHVMDFVVDESRAELVAAGPCFSAGGVSIVSLVSGSARLLAAPGSVRARSVCGARLAVVGPKIVMARTGRATASASGGASVVLVDRQTGRIVRTIRSSRGEAVDVLATS